MKRTWKMICSGLLMCGILQPYSTSAESNLNSAYLFFGETSSYMEQLNKTNQSLQVVHPHYFDLDDKGDLVITRKFQEEFVREMKKRNIKIVPFLTNNFDKELGRKALANKERLTTQLVAFMNRHHLDGINIDIENIDHEDRENFTAFIQLLREKMPTGTQLSIAIPANPDQWTEGWHGAYDNEKLALSSDYLFIMAYDQNWAGDDTDGPVAGYNWVEQSIQVLLAEGVPAKKLVLGIPFYGRYWHEDGEVNGSSVSMDTAVSSWIKKYNIHYTFDPTEKTYTGTFTVGEGEDLPSGDYTIWFDAEKSIKEKLKLVNKYGLKGAGSWALNQEHAATWQYFRHWLNENYFSVYEKGNLLGEFQTLPDAIKKASSLPLSKVESAKTGQTLWDNYPVKDKVKKITIRENIPYYAEPKDTSPAKGHLEANVVSSTQEKEVDHGWYHIQTGSGYVWVKGEDVTVQDISSEEFLSLSIPHKRMFLSPADTIGIATPAKSALEPSTPSFETEKWLGKDISFSLSLESVQEQSKQKWIFIEEKTAFYDSPRKSIKVSGWIHNQRVLIVEEQTGWYLIDTWNGLKWIASR